MGKEDLGAKTLGLLKNSWKAIPGVGFLYYFSKGDEIDLEKGVSKSKRVAKNVGYLAWAFVGGLFVSNLIIEGRANEKIDFYKDEIEKYVDNGDGILSNKEDFEMKKLMEIQDSSKTYIPTERDWKVGYWNIIKEKKLQDILYKKDRQFKTLYWENLKSEGDVKVTKSVKVKAVERGKF